MLNLYHNILTTDEQCSIRCVPPAAFPESDQLPENKVSGCVSQVYITANLADGKVLYQGNSDAQLVKGLVGLLVEGLRGLTPAEIVTITPDFIQDTGLNVNLTPSRANGFYNIFQMMKKKGLLSLGSEQLELN
ncbi:SufE family protein [Microcoleus sp. S28C3]|uniref:SufE family protein n=1 Tax=Microcoleus sp. S28C3 TaxID=3055414 RepID=UPI002FD075ED